MFSRLSYFSVFKKIKNVKPPKPPSNQECCGDGCRHCVWTTYFQDLKKYKESKRKINI